MRVYKHLEPERFASYPVSSTRKAIQTAACILDWISETKQKVASDGAVTATFVVDVAGRLWLADRHTEHFSCAAGQDVLAAGELTFQLSRAGTVEVLYATNQSTGYCPEPDSWPAVAAALERAGLAQPDGFTMSLIFRRCDNCAAKNIVKDQWFYCDVCQAPLAAEWNFD